MTKAFEYILMLMFGFAAMLLAFSISIGAVQAHGSSKVCHAHKQQTMHCHK